MALMQLTVWQSASEVALGDVIQEETVPISGTSTPSSAIDGTNRVRRRVRIFCDADAWVTWGSTEGGDPVADDSGSNGRMIGAGNPEYFDIECGYKVAVLARA